MACFEQADALFLGTRCPGKELDQATRTIRRNNGDYVTIHTDDGAVLLICTHQVECTAPVDPAEATERVSEALLHLDGAVRKPVNTSRAWALHDNRQPGDYKRRGAAPRGCFPVVVDRLKHRRMPPAVETTDRGARAYWGFPEGWSDEQIDLAYEILASPPDETEAPAEGNA
jgi:hypothetical protein